MTSTATALVRACHPEPTAAVTLVAAGVAASAGAGWPVVVLVAAAVFTGQLSVGWLNDYLDADRDNAVSRQDKPIAAGAVSRRVVGVAVLVAAAACVPLSLAVGWVAGAVHLVAVVSAWAYNAGLKSTAASFAPYAVSFGLLPLFILMAAGRSAPWWLVAAGSLLGTGAHFANTLPDLADDAATGVRGLPHRLGAAASTGAAVAAFLAAMGCLLLGPSGPPGLVAVLLVATACVVIALALARPGARRAQALFRAIMCTALLAVAMLLTVPL
ncbi:UbiA family prenyltransferase [Actinokineospora pegani]|uniref:UbiA family prenyltransferase n=1 Tax=Actinokineospora pegani TaxID=2654637 RepID=UPI0012EAF0B4|nr:UbiA family prenyltransferase [Actinokineospora pegani]